VHSNLSMCVEIGKSIQGAWPIPSTATAVMSLSCKALHQSTTSITRTPAVP